MMCYKVFDTIKCDACGKTYPDFYILSEYIESEDRISNLC